jgi:hypothetical protein
MCAHWDTQFSRRLNLAYYYLDYNASAQMKKKPPKIGTWRIDTALCMNVRDVTIYSFIIETQ